MITAAPYIYITGTKREGGHKPKPSQPKKQKKNKKRTRKTNQRKRARQETNQPQINMVTYP